MHKVKYWLTLYLVFCLIGFVLEWAYGVFWNIVGTTPWIYPNSPLHYTSFEGIPLWGAGGLIIINVYFAIRRRKPRFLIWVIPLLVLNVLWILLYSRFIA